MTSIGGKQQTGGTAKRIRKSTAYQQNVTVMATVTCESCGAQFAIGHRSPFLDAALAARQAVWLADQLVWDHIQEARHRATVSLPDCNHVK